MKLFIHLLIAVVLLVATAQAEPRFSEHQLRNPRYTFAYLTTDYNYMGGIPEDQRVTPGRFFVTTTDGNAADLQKYISEAMGRPVKLKHVTNDKVLERKELAGKQVYEITKYIPEIMRTHIGRQGEAVSGVSTCSNCLGAAKAFHTNERVPSLDTTEFRQYTSLLKTVPAEAEASFGEILYFPKSEHAAIWLFDGLVFQKPTWGVYHEYEIVPYEEMFDTFNRTVSMFNKGAPAGSITPSSWDIFLSGLMGENERGRPPGLHEAELVHRFRATTCAKALTEE